MRNTQSSGFCYCSLTNRHKKCCAAHDRQNTLIPEPLNVLLLLLYTVFCWLMLQLLEKGHMQSQVDHISMTETCLVASASDFCFLKSKKTVDRQAGDFVWTPVNLEISLKCNISHVVYWQTQLVTCHMSFWRPPIWRVSLLLKHISTLSVRIGDYR